MGAQKNRLIETVLLSTHNTCFGREIRKLIAKNMLSYLGGLGTDNPWERSGSVVEYLIQDRRVAGSSLTGVTALWSLSKTHLS